MSDVVWTLKAARASCLAILHRMVSEAVAPFDDADAKRFDRLMDLVHQINAQLALLRWGGLNPLATHVRTVVEDNARHTIATVKRTNKSIRHLPVSHTTSEPTCSLVGADPPWQWSWNDAVFTPFSEMQPIPWHARHHGDFDHEWAKNQRDRIENIGVSL